VGLLCASNQNTKTSQAMYVQHNTDAVLCNHCFNRKTITMTHSDRVSVALVAQHAMHMSHIVICGLPGYTIFFRIISWMAWGLEKKVNKHEMHVLIFYTTSVW